MKERRSTEGMACRVETRGWPRWLRCVVSHRLNKLSNQLLTKVLQIGEVLFQIPQAVAGETDSDWIHSPQKFRFKLLIMVQQLGQRSILTHNNPHEWPMHGL